MKGLLNGLWMSAILWAIIAIVIIAPWHSCDTTETEKLKTKVSNLESMLSRDDKLLMVFTDGSWNRDCDYDLVPGELLADGSIRSSIIQICGD